MKIKPPDQSGMVGRFAAALKSDWRARARPEQLPPSDFSIWLFLAGRASGKNWADSHYVQEQGASGAVERIALIGATADATRFTMVEGAAGILAAAGDHDRPNFEASLGKLTWRSGTVAHLYSADSPELLRGPEFGLAWCDELASWRRAQETWDNLNFCMRGSESPKIIISTTPRPTKLIKELVAREGKNGVMVSRSTTYDNRKNLPPSFFAHLVKKYEGTRTGRQELNAELLLDVPGALWNSENLETSRVIAAPAMQRIVVAIDPSGSGSADADECGVLICGLGMDSEGYVIADHSGKMTPTEWARRAIDAYRIYKADRIVAETNFGSLMVLGTIAAVDPSVPTKAITSSRGKVLRAEPISALFEQGRCHLVGSFPELEDQLTSFTADYDRARDGSPDRVDALVFALTELMCGQPVGGYFNENSLLVNGEPVDMPQRVKSVFAVAYTASKGSDVVGVIFAATSHPGVGYPITILDFDLAPVDESLFTQWLPRVYRRLRALCVEADALGGEDGDAGLWVSASQGVCAAILGQGMASGRRILDIDAIANLPPSLADRAAAAARFIHPGKKVKITRAAHDKMLTSRGVTKNHLLSQLHAFKLDDEETDGDELLNALFSAVLVAVDDARVVEPNSEVQPEPPSAADLAHQAAQDSYESAVTAAQQHLRAVAIHCAEQGRPMPTSPSAAGVTWPERPGGTIRVG
jgi:predicted phage terminase large subunit-like protein